MALSDVSRDSEGFLTDLNQWTPELARELAREENIELSKNHEVAIEAARAFHQQFETSPSMRAFIKFLKREGHDEIASSIALLKLFPGSPPKYISKIAGLPKPENCL
ncbi:TusE/DsrC/DsvC family sulfur relay protein [Umboniibacter marinipuniceus]|uniref:Sulfurtransferase n=1 Tax=Umboniibacter marinipuniceus TaxID=569599 RepID=A0A3M0A7L7_9GAMM|nr:TusE/DsrC/DsvC family sulfur relay protein [Umboniibacter marinipuniceus]RMA81073.1 tRNA 2-thiouridine synthesizing protein E [Umboniibacter marinipuniceus]